MAGPFSRSKSLARGLRQTLYLFALPRRVARFYVRALLIALRRGDRRSLVGSSRPRELAALLRAAQGRRSVIEIGTGTAWTTIALLLSDDERHVVTYDPLDYVERGWYLNLLGHGTRSRLELVARVGDPPSSDLRPDLVFIDSSHEREETISTFLAWSERIIPGGVIAFHDYGDPAWPGVQEAIDQLQLSGRTVGYLFFWSAVNAPARTTAD